MLLFQRLNQNVKFKKIRQNFKINFENLFQSFQRRHWHIDHVCQVSWESEKNCRKSSDKKKFDDTHPDKQSDRLVNQKWMELPTSITCTKPRWLQASGELKVRVQLSNWIGAKQAIHHRAIGQTCIMVKRRSITDWVSIYIFGIRRYACVCVRVYVCSLWAAKRLGRSGPNLVHGFTLTKEVFKESRGQ